VARSRSRRKVSKNRAGRKANADKPITILVFPGLSLMRTIQVNSDTLFVRCPGCGASATHSAAHPPAAFGHENDRCPVLAADSGGNGRGAGGDRGRGGTELMSTEASLMDAIDVTYPPRGSQIVLLINWDLCRAEGWGASDADWDTFVLPGLCQPLGGSSSTSHQDGGGQRPVLLSTYRPPCLRRWSRPGRRFCGQTTSSATAGETRAMLHCPASDDVSAGLCKDLGAVSDVATRAAERPRAGGLVH
jgi:hypothetical protein